MRKAKKKHAKARSVVAQIAALTRAHFGSSRAAYTVAQLRDHRVRYAYVGRQGVVEGYAVYVKVRLRHGPWWAIAGRFKRAWCLMLVGVRKSARRLGAAAYLMRLRPAVPVVTYTARHNTGGNALMRSCRARLVKQGRDWNYWLLPPSRGVSSRAFPDSAES